MATTQYIGSRYVPILADPVEWSNQKTYEPLTIVTHEGNSYTSRQFVPVGIDIADDDYWALTGNYNAQIEQYRRETAQSVETNREYTDTAVRASREYTDTAVEQVNNWLTDAQDKYGAKPFAFDTVAKMQENYELLYVGAICHTNGFYENNDGGGSWYKISDSGTINYMDVLPCGGFFAINVDPNPDVKKYGYSEVHELGTVVNYMLSKFNTIEIPDGEYVLRTTIDLKNTCVLNFGINARINFDNITAITNTTYPLLYAAINGGRFYGKNKSGIGIKLNQARNCTISNVFINNVNKGIVIDGQSTWSASNTIINPVIYLFNTGIHLTANSGKQTNDTTIFGGYVIDEFESSTATALLIDAACDTNKCYGLAVEDCNIGYNSNSVSATMPLALFGCRAENCNIIYENNANSKNNIIVGCNFSANSTGVTVRAPYNQLIDYFNINDSFITQNGILYFYDTTNTRRTLARFDAEDNKKFVIAPRGSNYVLAMGGTDTSQVMKEYIRVGGANGLVFPQVTGFVMRDANGVPYRVTMGTSGQLTITRTELK